jgi:hypothetical protein
MDRGNEEKNLIKGTGEKKFGIHWLRIIGSSNFVNTAIFSPLPCKSEMS